MIRKTFTPAASNNGTADYRIQYDSYSEFIESCDKCPTRNENDGFSGSAGFSGIDYATAYDYASNGWKTGRDIVKLNLDKLDISAKVKKPELFFDVTGDYGFDMGLVMAGEPENVVSQRDSQEYLDKKNGPCLRMLVNTVISSGIEQEIIFHRGAAIVALVDALEASGRRVEIDMICSASFFAQSEFLAAKKYGGKNQKALPYRTLTHAMPLKRMDEVLQIDQMAFAIGHPAIERRFNFIVLEQFRDFNGQDVWSNNGYHTSYGAPIDVDATGYDIYFPKLYYGEDQWSTLEKTYEWIHQQLKAWGVKLDGETED